MTDRKVAVLHDNPPLPGKKLCLVSMISPESRQKHDVYGFKLHDMCETEQEAEMLTKYYHNLDPDFDVYTCEVGKWCPWIWDPLSINNVEYANEFLTDLIRGHRVHQKQVDQHWKSEHQRKRGEIMKGATREGQLEMANRKEPAVSVWFKIKQIENIIKKRKEELEQLEEVFHMNYSKSDRIQAKKSDLPLSEPPAMQYTLLGSNPEDDTPDDGHDVNNEQPLPLEE
jgi:hypothetical protein